MDRIGHFEPAFVVGLTAFGRKFLLLRAIQISNEGAAGHRIVRDKLVAREAVERAGG